MEHATVTLLQSATLGRQTLSAGVQVRVPLAQAQAWAQAGIAAMDAGQAQETASEPDAEQKPQLAPVNADDEAIETVAKPIPKRGKKG